MGERAFQDQGSVSHCHGCGADNEKGLQIKSFWDGEEAVATWNAQPHHCGGSKDIVNGGIVASLIDCHSLNLAIAQAYRAEAAAHRKLAPDWVRPGNLNISYLKPTPIGEPLHLKARITKIEGRKAWSKLYAECGGTSVRERGGVGRSGCNAIET